MLSCASCMRPVHEYGCAKDEELVHGQYWQCEECRASHKKIHPSYRTLQQQTFENIHKTKKTKMNSLQKWNIIRGHKHDNNAKQKSGKQTQIEKDHKQRKTKTQQTQHGKMTQARCTQTTETSQRAYVNS